MVPETLRAAFLTIYHDQSGHLGVDKSVDMLCRRVWWPGCQADMARHVKGCLSCAMAKHPKHRVGELLHPTMGERPFEVLQVDSLFLPEDDTYNHVIVMICPLTRWVECSVETQEPDSRRLLQILLEHWILRHGCPRLLVCDRGSNLVSRASQEFYELFGIRLQTATTGHHRTVGAVERFNATLCSMIRACRERQEPWPPYIPFLLFSYRCAVHHVTKESPYALVYGQDPLFPADIALLGPAPATAQVGPATREWFQDHAERLHAAWVEAGRRTMKAHQRDKGRRDKGTYQEVAYQLNDRVLLLKQPLPSRGKKLELPWDGIFRIAEVLKHDNYRLRDLHNRRLHDVVHVSRLQPCPTPDDDEPLHAEEYMVDSLLDQRMAPNGEVHYKVRWYGLPLAQASWVPASALEHRCWDLMLAYDRKQRKQAPQLAEPQSENSSGPEPPGSGQLTEAIMDGEERAAEATVGKVADTPPIEGSVRAARVQGHEWMYEIPHHTHSGGLIWRWRPLNALTPPQRGRTRFLRQLARAFTTPRTAWERRDWAAASLQQAANRMRHGKGATHAAAIPLRLEDWNGEVVKDEAARAIQEVWRTEWPRLHSLRGDEPRRRKPRGHHSRQALIGYARLIQHLYRRRKARPTARWIWRPVTPWLCKGGLNLCGPAAFRDQATRSSCALGWYAQYPRMLAALRGKEAMILDCFCGAGGASIGITRLPGVRVIGLDHLPQPTYSARFGAFIQGNAVDGQLLGRLHRLHGFDAVWASPPCQPFSTGRFHPHCRQPNLVAEARRALAPLGIPYIIEQVMGARNYIEWTATVLRGCYFGLRCDRPRYLEPHRFGIHMDEFLRWHGERYIRRHACLGERRRYPRLSPFGVPEKGKCCDGTIWSCQGNAPYKTTLEACSHALGMGKPKMNYHALKDAVPPVYATMGIAQVLGQILAREWSCPYLTYDEYLRDPDAAEASLAASYRRAEGAKAIMQAARKRLARKSPHEKTKKRGGMQNQGRL